ncbi:MAG: glycogen/starch synthase [Syntrophaceae bacterium]|nr:glycogen/starch synthase [Syntrophaceae bacterium]
MPLLTLYFQLHQPMRLHPDRDKYLWDDMNREVFLKVSEKCYLPALSMFVDLVKSYPDFKITLSMSGTFLEQAEHFKPEVIKALKMLVEAGEKNNQVEYLDETYYHSLSSLYEDPHKSEFRDQVSLHRDKIRRLFGIFPTSFRNTELMYNNQIAEVVADMGYVSMLCEKRNDMFTQNNQPISPNAVFRARETSMIVLPRNRELSDDIAFRFPHMPISPDEYAGYIAQVDGEAVILGFDFEHIGEHIWKERGIFEFWNNLPAALVKAPSIVMQNPTEIAKSFENDPTCPIIDIHALSTSSWADAGRDTFGWLGNPTQYSLFRDIERMELDVKKAGGELLTKWRYLTTSDHVYFLHEHIGEDHAVHSYFNPYGGSIAQPTIVLTRKIDDLERAIGRYEILKRAERTAVLLVTPETGRLPEDMGELARFISGKSGGQGEVVSALCEGLSDRGIDVHIATLNLKKRFQKESKVNDKQWKEIRYKMDSKKIHLISSAIFSDNMSAYDGNPLMTAAEYQRAMINDVIKNVRSRHKGKMIMHTHDWMAGGMISAYARASGIPYLHTVHNVFTSLIPVDNYIGVGVDELSEYLYFGFEYGRRCIDAQATAIKNATLINFVGERFLREVVEGYFMDRHIIPWSVRNEVKAKFYSDAAKSIINAPASIMYPENCEYLMPKYGTDNFYESKQANRVEFQKRTGLNIDPNAILFFWPSRLDPTQKGVELLEEIAGRFVEAFPDAQIALVSNGVGNDRTHVDIMGRIAYSSGGKITCQPFSDELSMLGYAAASDVFGASLYEPCGQIDQVGNLFGATATNRDTGGYHDKIRELRLKIESAPVDVGNGFLFRDYDSGGLWYGLQKSVLFHRKPLTVRIPQLKRIMVEARERYDLNKMIVEYLRLYEKLNGGRPLA